MRIDLENPKCLVPDCGGDLLVNVEFYTSVNFKVRRLDQAEDAYENKADKWGDQYLTAVVETPPEQKREYDHSYQLSCQKCGTEVNETARGFLVISYTEDDS